MKYEEAMDGLRKALAELHDAKAELKQLRKAKEEMDDVERAVKNSIWQKHGCHGLAILDERADYLVNDGTTKTLTVDEVLPDDDDDEDDDDYDLGFDFDDDDDDWADDFDDEDLEDD